MALNCHADRSNQRYKNSYSATTAAAASQKEM
jgi:hypothetical protein